VLGDHRWKKRNGISRENPELPDTGGEFRERGRQQRSLIPFTNRKMLSIGEGPFTGKKKGNVPSSGRGKSPTQVNARRPTGWREDFSRKNLLLGQRS